MLGRWSDGMSAVGCESEIQSGALIILNWKGYGILVGSGDSTLWVEASSLVEAGVGWSQYRERGSVGWVSALWYPCDVDSLCPTRRYRISVLTSSPWTAIFLCVLQSTVGSTLYFLAKSNNNHSRWNAHDVTAREFSLTTMMRSRWPI